MGARPVCGKKQKIAGRDRFFTLRGSQQACSADNVKAFLVFCVVMVGVGCFLGRYFVNRYGALACFVPGEEYPLSKLVFGVLRLVFLRDVSNVRLLYFIHNAWIFLPCFPGIADRAIIPSARPQGKTKGPR